MNKVTPPGLVMLLQVTTAIVTLLKLGTRSAYAMTERGFDDTKLSALLGANLVLGGLILFAGAVILSYWWDKANGKSRTNRPPKHSIAKVHPPAKPKRVSIPEAKQQNQ